MTEPAAAASPLTVYYFARMAFPHGAAHAIQTVDNCRALAEVGCEVLLINGRRRGWSVERGLGYYGVPPHPRLHVLPSPCLSPGESVFRSRHAQILYAALARRRLRPPEPACIFVRQIPMAALLLRWRRLFPYPIVFELHNMKTADLLKPELTEGERRGLEPKAELERRVLPRLDGVICIAPGAEDLLRRHLSYGGPVAVIPLGGRVVPDALSGWDVREGVVYVGSLGPDRGADDLVRAMALLPGVHLTVVGGREGANLRRLRSLAGSLGLSNVEFVGFVEPARTEEYLRRARVGVIPLRESSLTDDPRFSLKANQYAGAGLAIAATACRSNLAVFGDGEGALMFPPGDVAAMADAIGRLSTEDSLAQGLAESAYAMAGRTSLENRAEREVEFMLGLARSR